MALTDKNIIVVPNNSNTSDPKIAFTGANSSVGPMTINMVAYPASNGTLSFEGSAGQLFSITNDLSGRLFSVSDISGLPSVSVEANGMVSLAPFGGVVAVGPTSETTLNINSNTSAWTPAFGTSEIAPISPTSITIHRHSTSNEPAITGARSNSNTAAHTAVTAGQNLLTMNGAGYAGANGYQLFGSISISTSNTGTIGATSAPGKIVFNTTPNNAVAPTTTMILDWDKSATIAGKTTIGSTTTTSISRLYIHEPVSAFNGSAGVPTSTLVLGANTNANGGGAAIDFNACWAGGYIASNNTVGWITSRIGGIYDASVGNGGALVFYTSAGPDATGGANYANLAERVRIGPSGSVGIGNTAPAQKLHVQGTGLATSDFRAPIFYDSDNTAYYLDPANTTTSSVLAGTVTLSKPWSASDTASNIYLNGTTGNRIEWNSNGVSQPATTTRSAGTKVVLYPGMSATTVDYAIGIESYHMWFSATNTLAGFKWYANTTNIATANVSGLYVAQALGVGTAPSGTAGEIRATNNITAYYSDERLKTNIQVIPGALGKVQQLRGVTYISNETAATFGYTNTEEQVGVIAQDVEKVLPQVVKPAPFDIIKLEDGTEASKSGQNYKTVQYDKIIPLLIEAIKEQQIQIEQLRQAVENK